jgi:hypothetical protein
MASNNGQSPLFPHRDGFHQLPPSQGSMATNRRDHLEDIPLEKVVTHGSISGARKPSSTAGYTNTAVNSSPSSEPHRPRIGRRRTNAGLDSADGLKSSEESTLKGMGKVYQKIVNFSVITRYFIYVLPVAILLAIPIIIGIFVAPNTTIQKVRLVWFFMWIEVVWMSIWIAKIFAHFLPIVFQFLVGVVSPGVRKYAQLLKNLELPLSFVGWALASLCSFSPIMLENPDTRKLAVTDASVRDLQPGFQTIMGHILGACLVCSIIFLVERFLVQLISITYHRAQFDEKIKENKRSIFLLGLLYDASRKLFPEYCKEFQEEDYIINDALNLSALGKNRKGSPANPIRLIQNVGHGVGRFGDKVGAAFGTVANEITGKRTSDLDSSHAIVVEALEKSAASEALAKRLWLSFVVEGRDALILDDVLEVLGPQRRSEAEEAFASIDKDSNGDISLEEMILTIGEIGRARKSINCSMHDVDQAIRVLDKLLLTVVFIICVFVFGKSGSFD